MPPGPDPPGGGAGGAPPEDISDLLSCCLLHAQALLAAAAMHPRVRVDGGPSSPAEATRASEATLGSPSARAAEPASSGYTTGLLVWCLGALVVLVFFLQGSSLGDARLGSGATRLGWARLQGAVAGAGGGKRGAALAAGPQDPQVELLQALTAALDEATAELDGNDRELRALRLQQRSSSDCGGGAPEAAAAAGAPGAAAPAAAAEQPPAAAARALGLAGPAGSVQPPAPGDAELLAALESLPFYPLPSAAGTAGWGSGQACTACLRHGSGLQDRTCLPAPCPYTPPTAARVVSTSLYGDAPRYAWGAIRNAELMPAVFPGWRLRVYTRSDMLPSQDTLNTLRTLGADIVTIDAADKSAGFGMNWRFLVGDDAGVEAFLCRDGDSRVSLRDRWAAEAWLAPPPGQRAPFHIVRDHPSHAGYKLMGGTWGAETSVFRDASKGVGSIKSILEGWVASKGHGDYGSDIDFLTVRSLALAFLPYHRTSPHFLPPPPLPPLPLFSRSRCGPTCPAWA